MGRSSKNKKRKRSLDNNDISSSSTVAAADVAPVSTIIKANNNQNQKQKKIKKKKQKTSKSRLRSEQQQQQRFWNEDCKDLPLLSNYNNNCGSSIGTKREWTAEAEFNTIKNVIDIEWLMTDDDDDDDKEQVNINPIPLNEEDEVFETIKNCKQAFEDIPSFLFTKARRLTNKFEVLGKGRRFINRSAMKLANMDHFLKLIIPPPSSESKAESSSLSDDDCHFVGFADLCGGPGGFSEYLQWKMPSIIGWGITLNDSNTDCCNWKIDGTPNLTLEYGDLTNNETILKFVARILSSSKCAKGVNLVVGDGGFVQARDKEDQETMMHRLILCQMITMYHILQPGGNFVCKTFEISNQFSISLIALLVSTFHQVAIVKPVTSRPASSERYIIAKNLRQRSSEKQLQELLQLNANWNDTKDDRRMVATTIPKIVYSKLKDIHYRLATVQEQACRAILEYAMTQGKGGGGGNHSYHQAKTINRHAYYDYWGV